jgi:hypothetical protein
LVREALALQAGERVASLDPGVVRTFAVRLRDVIRIEGQKPRFV